MTRFVYDDVVVELVDLCRDLMIDIIQQLDYYRASVYKNETRPLVDAKVNQLKVILELFADTETLDLFNDYEAAATLGNTNVFLGDCLLSLRISALFTGLRESLDAIEFKDKESEDCSALLLKVHENRSTLVSLCKYSFRRRTFFENL